MTTPRLDLPDPDAVARTLTATLDAMEQSLFAVIDGGLFDDLPGDLLRAGFSCRSLFLDHADAEVERAGPWLVELDSDRARMHVERLAVAQPCAVFWSCGEGEMALWRHLRTINEVLIPQKQDQPAEVDEGGREISGYERVLFRHWDPNVLASVMPVLDAAQFLRVFGPATHIVMNAPDFGGLQRAPRPQNLPAAPPLGPLRLRAEQMEGLKQAMVRSSRLRIACFLRKTAPAETAHLDDSQLLQAVKSHNVQAKELGIDEERAQARFAWLMLCSNGKFVEQPGVQGFLRRGKGTPNSRLHQLSEAMAEAAMMEKS